MTMYMHTWTVHTYTRTMHMHTRMQKALEDFFHNKTTVKGSQVFTKYVLSPRALYKVPNGRIHFF